MVENVVNNEKRNVEELKSKLDEKCIIESKENIQVLPEEKVVDEFNYKSNINITELDNEERSLTEDENLTENNYESLLTEDYEFLKETEGDNVYLRNIYSLFEKIHLKLTKDPAKIIIKNIIYLIENKKYSEAIEDLKNCLIFSNSENEKILDLKIEKIKNLKILKMEKNSEIEKKILLAKNSIEKVRKSALNLFDSKKDKTSSLLEKIKNEKRNLESLNEKLKTNLNVLNEKCENKISFFEKEFEKLNEENEKIKVRKEQEIEVLNKKVFDLNFQLKKSNEKFAEHSEKEIKLKKGLLILKSNQEKLKTILKNKQTILSKQRNLIEILQKNNSPFENLFTKIKLLKENLLVVKDINQRDKLENEIRQYQKILDNYSSLQE